MSHKSATHDGVCFAEESSDSSSDDGSPGMDDDTVFELDQDFRVHNHTQSQPRRGRGRRSFYGGARRPGHDSAGTTQTAGAVASAQVARLENGSARGGRFWKARFSESGVAQNRPVQSASSTGAVAHQSHATTLGTSASAVLVPDSREKCDTATAITTVSLLIH